ncbi:acetyl/propionyl/methylcrotonyl-CoA carboxylase subunit alpha [Brevibacillus porteri]|uniref:biotin carboxylase n=1 Tax=Brevibacillus porteri TaxID=2126350 RepID=A0ABX5FK61_9BACL|nr:acetyl-CoA carboxylase biotin carboxylase subunit [Brevibacillus porteri]MED1802488.1 acetyl-CoA carboxylase biotin carboxylase subunit [Brevibacillus porteri]MED2134134.1 acetyl-CoA carboxylase biotin carboxylase subunit [Brevibacillus porteri]MED2745913.1 acetyl-CoA carboxylase biotin carboxylase subunit [Brevibacillus porteri]MED2814029.1 acetyl-CoA carboxylase biotin carboxylase subunit [Brevibacillus porteri]MED2894103.1 acetyl-CoA carboxylase biotin carboxylase subunit [Brevibacillus 
MRKVLIANRGEIARRIIRTCKARGVATVAVYSDADKDLPFVREADESVHIGPPPVPHSYLNVEAILGAAKSTGADAIHPGYGLLSENEAFARRVLEEGLLFIGPTPEVIGQMGDKLTARHIMETAGVPVVPGCEQAIDSPDEAAVIAMSIGYPVMLKASAGGGGIGMHICRDEAELRQAYQSAKGRAKAYFGNDAMYMEKYVERPRHIEVQVVADQHGNVIHLLERECSIQRRHQKVLEESPSPFLDIATRELLCDAAVTAAKAVSYSGVGTVEFIVDEQKNFYFLEMNTRLQVEHPVTEEMTGIDLVSLQLDIADGHPLSIEQEDVKALRHAIELRVYAEDPVTFLPSPGTITLYQPPAFEHVRIDDGVETGTQVTPFYDPMIAKVIVSGATRQEAVQQAQKAMDHFLITGIKTNIPFLQEVLQDDQFRAGNYTTWFVTERGAASSKEKR